MEKVLPLAYYVIYLLLLATLTGFILLGMYLIFVHQLLLLFNQLNFYTIFGKKILSEKCQYSSWVQYLTVRSPNYRITVSKRLSMSQYYFFNVFLGVYLATKVTSRLVVKNSTNCNLLKTLLFMFMIFHSLHVWLCKNEAQYLSSKFFFMRVFYKITINFSVY